MMHGFLNIDKPAGPTSHDVVARIRRLARQKRVGHAGTLDPAATGVLVVALGAATRLIEYVQDATTKRYHAVVRLGATTTTDDAEGQVLASAPVPALDTATIELALTSFRGPITQIPPMYAALHHDGHRLHELARAGQVVERAARPVVIEQLDLLDWSPPLLTLDILCGKGTYIRALARDLGAALGCGAHLQALRRTAVGGFLIDTAVPLDALVPDTGTRGHGDTETRDTRHETRDTETRRHGDTRHETRDTRHETRDTRHETRDTDGELQPIAADRTICISEALIPPERAVADWPAVELDAAEAHRIRNGLAIVRAGLIGARARAHGPDGALLALLDRDGEQWKPQKVFDWSS